MFDEDVLERVRRTWAMAAAAPERTTQAFYANLFRNDPSAKPLFQGDMGVQGRKLAQTLTFVVDHLDDLDTLVPEAKDLAVRHVSYNVTKEQYASVGAALMATFRQLLGAEFSKQDEAAWTHAYGVLSDVMCEAAYG